MKTDYLYWEFPTIVPSVQIEQLLTEAKTWPIESGKIGEQQEQAHNIRQVQTQRMSEYHSVGLIMYALGIKANQRCWQYDVAGPAQCELLTYGEGGDKYDAHVDTGRLADNLVRKLTVILMLNDQYEGGRFYFQTDLHHRQYIENKTGTILVFPSHQMHGVEPIEKGTRHSVVSWLSGPDFK
jgi:PKHD-type hydroxylase